MSPIPPAADVADHRTDQEYGVEGLPPEGQRAGIHDLERDRELRFCDHVRGLADHRLIEIDPDDTKAGPAQGEAHAAASAADVENAAARHQMASEQITFALSEAEAGLLSGGVELQPLAVLVADAVLALRRGYSSGHERERAAQHSPHRTDRRRAEAVG